MVKLLTTALLAIPMLHSQVVTADNCVHQAGDNLDWARPDFDDRHWSRQVPRLGSPYLWTRCRMDLASLPRTAPLHIGVKIPASWELFVDGVAAGSHGDLRTGYFGEFFHQRVVPATAGKGAAIILALRHLHGRVGDIPTPPILVAGEENALWLWHSRTVINELWDQWPHFLGGAFSLIIGIVLLLLFTFSGDRSQRELLWFGLFALLHGIRRVADLPMLPVGLTIPVMALCVPAVDLVSPRIFFALAGRRLPGYYLWLSVAAAGVSLFWWWANLQAPIGLAQNVNSRAGFAVGLELLVRTSAAAAFWPLPQVPRPLRLARNLSLLMLLAGVARLVPQLPGLDRYGWLRVGSNAQAFLITFALIGLFVVIAKRHRQISLDRAELQGEMKSAQEVQRLLTSSTLDVAPWASVEVAYLPAKEVGGDFYFCRQTPEGQLVVVGDVSGKGLRAAMLASVALGAVRHSKTSSPGALLQDLNATLYGQTGGGFVTCCAALLRQDGQLIVANAGHPSPYAGGREFTVEAGLPLGIVADATYEESSGPGESITLVSDGVVEAETTRRELFGFDRTRDISTQPAHAIAKAAQTWGQNDDITVVTVRRKS